MDADKLFQYLSPVLSAFLASFLTHRFAQRAKRGEVLFQERLTVFKELHKRLVGIKRYCEARLADYVGHEFAPGVDGLPADNPASALSCSDSLHTAMSECEVFLTAQSRPSLDALMGSLSLACSFELNSMGQPDLQESGPSMYSALIEKADDCIGKLYLELQFPGR